MLDVHICLASNSSAKDLSLYLDTIKLVPDPPPCEKVSCAGHPYSGGIITFEDGQLDISAFVDRAKILLQQSDYQNQQFFGNLFLFEMAITRECRISMIGLPDHQIQSCQDHAERALDEAEIQLRQLQADRFLLPDNYYGVGNIPNDRLRDIRQTLNSGCSTICSDQAVLSMLSHGTQEQYNETVRKLSEKGPSCLKKALATLGKQIQQANESINFPNSCEGETGRQREICNTLKLEKDIIIERLSNLTDLVISESPSEAVQALDICLENKSPLFVLEDLDEEMACSDYQPGEERDISIDPWTHYRIKRETDGSYTASIAMTFSPASDYDNEENVPRNQVDTHYRQLVTNCLRQANPKMLGPNGEQLNIVIKEPQPDSCLPQLNITIQSSNGRSNSGSYEADIGCSYST